MSTSCSGSCKPQSGYPTERKVIDTNGRLGSLYDASTDNLVDQHAVRASETKRPDKLIVSRTFSGVQSRELISFLRNIGFDDAVQRSIRHQLVAPCGASRLVEYNQPVNQNTRFLYYSYRHRQEKLRVKAQKAHRIVSPPSGPSKATHMITKIVWGFEILCVIQITRNVSVNAADQLLRYICNELERNRIPVQLNNDDRRLINQLNNITVFGSEICVDDPNTSILTVLGRINDWQKNPNFHQPLSYTMQPLRWLYNIPFSEPIILDDPVRSVLERVHRVQNRIENQMKHLGETIHNLPTTFSSLTLNQSLKEIQQQYRYLLDTQEDLQTRLQKTIPDVRRKHVKPIALDNIITDQRYRCLHEQEIDKFQIVIDRLAMKATLIEKLKNNRIEYVNAVDVCLDGRTPSTIDDIDIILKRSLSNGNFDTILWYGTDRLRREQADRWQQIHQQLISERQSAKLIYADFTNCRPRLEGFVTVRIPASGIPDTRYDPIGETVPRSPRSKSAPQFNDPDSRIPPSPLPPRSLTPSFLPKKPNLPRSVLPPSPAVVNVLLLGETGVGKSTFINAFVNYLKFNTLQQAEQGEPVVLIPVSFLITVGDQFEEFMVKFGNVDSNEDYEHEGQSVTQQCKSYLFDLNDKLRLRIIDTPGIGDTRGIAQDVKNIDHILTYTNNLSHLNAVCLLLKPNASRLNVFFRSCVHQLLTYLTPAGYDNIIFCFTNSRATFFAPGDTGPLLRKMLADEHLNDIPFQKQNSFCFDSESFRYLAARKCKINFDDYQRQECISSWTTSVAESIRLLNYIQTRKPYNLEEWTSPRKAALEISMLVRPLMETLRLIIYNWKLIEAKLFVNQMIITSNPTDTEMCTHCAQINIAEVGSFWVAQYQPVVLKNNAVQHRRCPSDGKHFLIESIVKHEFVAQPAGLKNERWQSSFHNFLLKCDKLHHFLRQQGPSAHDDPFESVLQRFLEEEQEISQIRNINSNMNRRIREVLQSIKQIRQQNNQQLFASNERLSLSQVYQIIDELIIIPTVKKQIEDIKRSRQLRMQAHELIIPTNSIRNRTFA